MHTDLTDSTKRSSGRSRNRTATRLAAGLVACLAILASPAGAEALSLEALMRELAQNAGGRATFVERKEIALLNGPVESRGELEFVPPARLLKRTLSPRVESMLVDGDRLLFERGDQRFELSLAATPEAAAFVESIRGTLAGDHETLDRVYKIRLEGGRDAWSLILFPRLARMQKIVAEIRIDGRRGVVQRVSIEQADGDRSIMQITPAAR